MSPVSGVLAPDSMRMKVDLPAPLAPTRPCTSPVSSTKLTLRNACTPGNDFETLRTRMASVDSLIRLLPIGDWTIVPFAKVAGLRARMARSLNWSCDCSVDRLVLVGVGLGDEDRTPGVCGFPRGRFGRIGV